ncbi:hypothetical protein R50072_35210 [Simiduia litorea]|uniref:DUF2884 family protein n=1 Tax=Simiduia litorea TaxID=1435348 RepID=UPI0036F420EC
MRLLTVSAMLLIGVMTWLPVQAEVHLGLDECKVSFAEDFSVAPEGVASTQGEKAYLISPSGGISIDGKPLTLNAEQKQLAANYAQGLQAFIPGLVAFVGDVLELVGKVLGEAFAAAFGENSEASSAIRSSLEKAQLKLAERVSNHEGTYEIKSEGIDAVDEAFDEEVEQAIEDAVAASMGSIWSLLGSALFSGEGTFASRMEAFGEKMETLGNSIDKNMDGKTESLERRGEQLCTKARNIERFESRLRASVPALAQYKIMVLRAAN